MKGLVCFAALLAVVAFSLPAVAASGPADPADGDRAALRRALSLIDRAALAPEAERAALVRSAVEALDAAPSLAGRWLRDPLAASPPDLGRARARLVAAVDALDRPAAAFYPEPARAALTRVLDDPRFHPPSLLSLLPAWLLPAALLVGTVVRFVWSLIAWPFERLFDLIRLFFGSDAFGTAMLALAAAVVAGLVLLYRRGLRAAIVAQAEVATLAVELPPTAVEAIAAAEAQAAAGRFRQACHFLLFAALLAIEERGAARFDRAATNREHILRLRDQPALAAALAPVVERFDRLWYGGGVVTGDEYRELLALASRVRETAA